MEHDHTMESYKVYTDTGILNTNKPISTEMYH